MALLVWTDFLSTGNEAIDNQHKHFIDIINKFFFDVQNNETTESVQLVLKELRDYSINHFSFEEGEMIKKNGYVTPLHLEEHGRFVTTIFDFEKRILMGEQAVYEEIADFISDWLYHHILDVDKKEHF